jgi:hypothetical protein
VIGHELGHVFAFAPLSSRCLLIHLLFAGGLTLAIAGVLAGSELRYAAPLFALWPARRLTYATTVADIRGIEFLCDDAASAAVGIDVAARAQLKLAAEAEVRSLLMDQVLEARLAGADLPLSALIATYEQALPYGSVDRAESEAAVRAGIERLRQTKGPSLIGLWRHLFTADDIDERAVANAVAAAQDVLAGRATVAACMAAIEDEPRRVLVHLPDEIDDRHDSHPNWSRRLLFLWRSQGVGRGAATRPGRSHAH